MHARNRAQLRQHLQVHGGPSLPRIISTAEVGADEQHLAALKSGKQLKVSFQNLGKETITVPMPLADFAPAYDKIK